MKSPFSDRSPLPAAHVTVVTIGGRSVHLPEAYELLRRA
jgi:hypothetical protein